MKREQRKLWMDANGDWLCSACRYSKCDGEYGCETYEWSCTHPLDTVVDIFNNGMEPGVDCWGFRPWKGEQLVKVVPE